MSRIGRQMLAEVTFRRRPYGTPDSSATVAMAPSPAPVLAPGEMAQQMAADPEFQDWVGGEWAAHLAAQTSRCQRGRS